MVKIKGLHHNAYRCRDSEETRKFYEDFLGLPLDIAFELEASLTGRQIRALHSFYRMGDDSFLAFFEVPDMDFTFTDHHDFDLHIALEVTMDELHAMFEKGKAEGREVRGISDHHFVHSIYFRDPNGYVVELTARTEVADDYEKDAKGTAHDVLAKWQSTKPAAKYAA